MQNRANLQKHPRKTKARGLSGWQREGTRDAGQAVRGHEKVVVLSGEALVRAGNDGDVIEGTLEGAAGGDEGGNTLRRAGHHDINQVKATWRQARAHKREALGREEPRIRVDTLKDVVEDGVIGCQRVRVPKGHT